LSRWADNEGFTVKRDKAKGERAIFRRFAGASGLSINLKSVRSRKPPRPDISCRLRETPFYFEITRMAHQGSANAMGHHLSELARKGTAPALAPEPYDDRAALREAIERKAAGKYQTDGRPIGLLVFIDGVFHPPHMPAPWARAVFEEKGPMERWNGIWLYDAVYDTVVASWPRNDKAAQHAAAADR
jgi:hypothetical protein